MTPHSITTGRKLIINADDYALTDGISRGILQAARHGVVTSTSVLAVGPSFQRAAQWLADTAGIGVGIHFALVGEDPPLLPASEIPTLVDRRGRFPRTWHTFAVGAGLGRVDPGDIARELTAQFERVAAIGHPISHVDAHQHLQLLPLIGQTIMALATRFRVRAIRVPDVSPRHPLWLPVGLLGLRLRHVATARGLLVPDRSVGIDVAGKLERVQLRATLVGLARSRARLMELTVHPGGGHDPQRARYNWGYQWEDELAALTDVGTRRLVDRLGFELTSYSTARPSSWASDHDITGDRTSAPPMVPLGSDALRGPRFN
jgi:predicted glycoside hydrolase/deacetylase ChbG (UPF0249 family)